MFNPSGLLYSIFNALNDVRYWFSQVVTNPKTFAFIGLIALLVIFYLISGSITLTLWWFALVLILIGFLWLIRFLWKRRKSRKAGKELGEAIEQQAKTAPDTKEGDLETLKKGLLEAVQTIKTSKLGQTSGNAALYELPWYIFIGNPSAGKSSAITHSGLQFPLADKESAAIRGIGGTRNCDWFFSTEGILVDTAGRYSVEEGDRNAWLGFLDLLKRYRPKAPINGIVVAASISELTTAGPEFTINLAKNLRQRVQELTERLEVFAPVYIFFTKADLIAGFAEFFASSDEPLRHRAWGATLPYPKNNEENRNVIPLFDKYFDELYQGLREMSKAQIALRQKSNPPPGLLTFPLEFAAIKSTLRTFLATLFENNPYQYKPVFRGFYFTSALQEGDAKSTSSARLTQQFALEKNDTPLSRQISSRHGFFLKDLFSKVILADKQLVRQHASPNKLRGRYVAFFAMVVAFGLLLGGWTWSYLGNKTLIENTQADLNSVIRVQQENPIGLEGRLDAMEILQKRIEQLEGLDAQRPFSVGMGLFQGDTLKQQLLKEYYHGLKQFMIDPVQRSMENYLSKVDIQNDTPPGNKTEGNGVAADTLYQDASPHSIDDAYNALKAYLMMANPQHVEPAHLADQITRFWRGWLENNRGTMTRDKLGHSAERLISFYVARANDADWPIINTNRPLVEKNRSSLRTVRRGMSARERVYTTIKTRASTRFQPMSVAMIVGESDSDLVTGSYAIPGTYTRQAWVEFIEPGFREASRGELQTTDWVLGVNTQDDLSLEGSPEQIFMSLADKYKKEYAEEWQKLLQGVNVRSFATFSQAADGMNQLGNQQESPIVKLLQMVYEQTAWDNPALAGAITTGQASSASGFIAWFKRVILRVPGQASVATSTQTVLGIVGEQFADVARLLVKHEQSPSMLDQYIEILSRVRTRFNLIQNEGDPGRGALKLLRDTLEGKESELSEALQFVDEQMLAGASDEQRRTLRPFLVRPLVQAYSATIPSAEIELNKIWMSKVYEPFNKNLLQKYPFDQHASIEAAAQEIAMIFGPQGSIASFVNDDLSVLTTRRGAILTARTWGDIGISLQPAFTAGFANWIAPLSGGASNDAAQPQTVFQIRPKPIQGATEYTIEIDGQQLRYRNTLSQWVNFVWPNPQGSPGVRITAIKLNGENVTIVNEPGRFGLERLIGTAQRTRNPDGSFEMKWSVSGLTVPVTLRIISNVQKDDSPDSPIGAKGFRGLRLPLSVVGSASRPGTNTGEATR